MKTVTVRDFLDRGYREYKDGFKGSTSFVQKTIYDQKDGGKLYFINIYYFEIGDHSGFQADTQFNRNGVTFNLELLDVNSVDQVEEFFDDVWNTLKCDRYDGQERGD